ncbi:receptor-like protein 12 isoform X1 [Gossypium australe]|uniref:Receptor-like protein 12 isoform X1 n=1 Tax=Gossypium australe TaxID=47621 RepID=A0A5B6VDU2_9ROSI|nr:receptor-like protein 12 isoform X1 [Gossypium australe]
MAPVLSRSLATPSLVSLRLTNPKKAFNLRTAFLPPNALNKAFSCSRLSLYSHKEVFLRELVSNASDALDKLRFLSVTAPSLPGDSGELEIRIKPDLDNGTITITYENKDLGADNGLIGQFGVGFYSAFLVAEKVVVSTKSPKSDKQYVWEAVADNSHVIREETDPENLLVHVLCSSPSSPTHLCSPNQSAVLFQFKTHFSINQSASKDCEYSYPKAKTTSWKKGTDCCLWDGVSCDNITGEVISPDLSCSCLSGTFPSNTTFFLLSSLQRLDLSFNDFRKSKISSKFGLFPSLTHLNLSNSWFSGPVPYEISYLSNLVSLHLSYRPSIDLIGFQALGPILTLEKSAVNGIVRNLTQVKEIDLDGIDMSSMDPNSFVNLSHSLTSLSLSGCHLRGKFPDNIFKLPNIEYLSLDENPKLTGQFLKSNWSSSLVVLGAFGFGLIGCNLSGPIPRSLGNLTQLNFLFLPRNYFSGKIPSSLANLAKLSILVLSDNQLEGFLPDNPNAFPNLAFLDLSNNLLSGTTPSWLYTIPRLIYLNLGNNQFNDHIGEFQNKVLNAIILKDNSFRGPIPRSIFKLVNLTSLDLSSNELNYTISLNMFSELQNLKKLDVFDLHSNFIDVRSVLRFLICLIITSVESSHNALEALVRIFHR